MDEQIDRWIEAHMRRQRSVSEALAEKRKRSPAENADGSPTRFFKRHKYFKGRYSGRSIK